MFLAHRMPAEVVNVEPEIITPSSLPWNQELAIARDLGEELRRQPVPHHFPSELSGAGLDLPWVLNDRTTLWMPTEADFEDRLGSSMKIKVLISASDLFPEFSADQLTSAAWTVLVQSPPDLVAFLAAQLALIQETAALHGQLGMIVDEMPLPKAALDSLRAATAASSHLFDERALREAICECAAAASSGTWARAASDDDRLVISALFAPTIQVREIPSIITALWILQAGEEADDASTAGLFSMVSAIGYQGIDHHFEWPDLALRTLEQWETADAHPAVRTANPKPADLRAHVESILGVSPTEFLAGVLLVTAAAANEVGDGGCPVLADEEWTAGMLSDVRPAFQEALERELTIEFSSLGRDVVAAAGVTYRGLGTVRMAGAEILRCRPLIRFGDAVVAVGFHEMIVGADAALRRVAHTSPGAPGSTLGYLLEAAVSDSLSSLSASHRVITSEEIDAIVPRGLKRCDAIVVNDGSWLLIEIGAQSPRPNERVGRHRDLVQRCDNYHEKLDQAEATVAHLSLIAKTLGIQPPRSVSMIVVAAEPIFGTPSLLIELETQRHGRQPRFVVAVAELADLIRLGRRTNAPLLVELWQQQAKCSSLSVSLQPTFRAFRIDPTDTPVSRWTSLIPKRRPAP